MMSYIDNLAMTPSIFYSQSESFLPKFDFKSIHAIVPEWVRPMLFEIANFFNFSFPGNETMFNLIVLFSEIFAVGFAISYILTEILTSIILYFNEEKKNMPYHYTSEMESFLDIFFLLFPTFVVLYILLPTLGFLFNMELSADNAGYTTQLSVTGHQWYWSYEYTYYPKNPIIPSLKFLSETKIVEQYNSILASAVNGRLLSSDNPVLFPVKTPIITHVTSADVAHSWAIPQLGIKVDALPGKVASAILYADVCDTWYGQCSELCGPYHAFMPIELQSVTPRTFYIWLNCNNEEFKFYQKYLSVNDGILSEVQAKHKQMIATENRKILADKLEKFKKKEA